MQQFPLGRFSVARVGSWCHTLAVAEIELDAGTRERLTAIAG
jgi:hypothetical protein